MSGTAGCPQCGGSGFLLDPDPLAPARPCPCRAGVPAENPGVPARYRDVTFESFWEWWKIQHPKDEVLRLLQEALQFMEAPDPEPMVRDTMHTGLELILHKCGARLQPGGEPLWKDLRPALEPQGYRPLFTWARQGRDHTDFWWIDGPPGCGRSSLAASALKAFCERTGKPGFFASIRTLGQELKDTYYDNRSWSNKDFVGERDRMAPLLKAPCLVLDDLDRMDSDLRVVRAMAQLLDHRYSERLPTLITASRWAETLANQPPELFPLARLEDASLVRRLASSRRVVMRPTLERLMEVLNG